MTGDVVLQIVGWVGSGLLVVSLLQSRMLALRVLNLLAAVILIAYNALLLVWPSVAMNVAVAGIDIFYLIVWSARRGPGLPSARRDKDSPVGNE